MEIMIQRRYLGLLQTIISLNKLINLVVFFSRSSRSLEKLINDLIFCRILVLLVFFTVPVISTPTSHGVLGKICLIR